MPFKELRLAWSRLRGGSGKRGSTLFPPSEECLSKVLGVQVKEFASELAHKWLKLLNSLGGGLSPLPPSSLLSKEGDNTGPQRHSARSVCP